MNDEKLIENEEKEISTVDLNKSLAESTIKIVEQIVGETDTENIKDLTNIFNLNQQKKNIIRLTQLNDLMDKVNEEALNRFESDRSEITNKELLDFMKVVQNNIDVSQRNITEASTRPMIQINQQNNFDMNISDESKTKILDTVNAILQMSSVNTAESNIIDADIIEEETEEEN